MKLVAVIVVASGAFFQFGLCCPTCPADGPRCDEVVRYTADSEGNCPCETCLTRCSDRYNPCSSGQVCVMTPVEYNGIVVGQTANCQPFVSCAAVNCTSNCSASGFLYDNNNCKTCTCIDPCKELNCLNGQCVVWSTNPGTEPSYECSPVN